MFGSLKKKLQDVVKKLSKDEQKEVTEEVKEIKEEIRKDLGQEKHEDIKETMQKKEETSAEETISEKNINEELEKTEKKAMEIFEKTLEDKEDKEMPEDIKGFFERDEKMEQLDKLQGHLKEKTDDEEKTGKAAQEFEETEKTIHEQELIREHKYPKKHEPIETLKPETALKKEEIEKSQEGEKKGFFGRFVKKVTEKRLTEDEVEKVLRELNKALLENDVAYPVAEKICDDVKKDLINTQVKRGKTEDIITESLRSAMLDVMQQKHISLEDMARQKKPLTVVFLGFNGTGKTTTIAKLAYKLKKKHTVVLAAGDTFRAASIEQLEEHGKRLGIDVIKHKYGADSAAVIFDARKHAEARGIDFVLADTAGRSHSNANLMDELKKVCRVIKPDLKILVLDSLTGNDIYNQSKIFDEAVGVDGIILTKADVYERGGAALSTAYTIKKPVLFIGVGQNYDDIKEFVPEEIVKNLLE